MFRYIVIIASVLILSIAGVQRAVSQEDVERTLGRAQALYYEAHFKDSVDILLPVDQALRQQPSRVGLSISVKLQLALGYIGQNQTEEAKSVLQEVCVLDPEYSLDSNQFAPKVLALYDDVKTKQKQTRCETFCKEIDRLSKTGDVQGLLNLTRDTGPGCVCGAAKDAAEVLFKQGLNAYKQENYAQALEKLRGALKFRPDHDLAIQYADLAESKIRLSIDRLLLDWRKSFEAQEFPQAAAAYRQLESSNIERKADPSLQQIRVEYRKIVASKVESWNQSCSTRTSTGLAAITELLPDPAIAADMVSKLTPCAPEPSAATSAVVNTAVNSEVNPGAAVPPVPQGCLQMESQLAMTRLKSRVNPDIPFNRLPVEPVDLRVKVKIAENGDVTVLGVQGSNAYLNAAMRDAVLKWKFIPAMVDDRRRCVETELPIRLSRS